MARTRGYHQYCPMATALDVVGDRWALLVVRELILGPRRFGELAAGLDGVGTDILTARLRQLEEAGVLSRTGAGRQQRYGLTGCGQALRPVLVELARWGSHRLGLPSSPEDIPLRVALTALVIDPPPPPVGLQGRFELVADGERAAVQVVGRHITVDPEDDPRVDATVLELTRRGLLGLLIGTKARALARAGDLVVHGKHNDGLRFADTVSGPGILDGLHHLRRPAPVDAGRSRS